MASDRKPAYYAPHSDIEELLSYQVQILAHQKMERDGDDNGGGGGDDGGNTTLDSTANSDTPLQWSRAEIMQLLLAVSASVEKAVRSCLH